ncbi:hypothetical protein Tco_1022824 [Tanacetum coccineum]
MMTLQFADTHNLVVFLAKPAESEGFEQIVDFLNAHTINAKTTAWNEFSSTMFSAIICLATNQKFNFSKYIFESMVKDLDNAGKFLMHPRFMHVFLNKQLEGMQSHKRIYITPSHTKKIFGNMKRVRKGFSRRDTPLFPTMMVQDQEEMGEGSANPTDPHHTPTIIQPSTSQPQKKQRSRRPKRNDTEVPQPSGPKTNVVDEVVYEERDDSLERAATIATGLDVEQDRGNINKTQSKETPNEPSSPRTSSGGGPRHQETIGDTIAQTRSENISKLSNVPLLTKVIDLKKTKTAQAQEITSLKLRVKKLEKKGGSRTHKLKRLYKVGKSARIVSSDGASLGDQEDASKHVRKIDDIDKDVEITLVHETQGRADGSSKMYLVFSHMLKSFDREDLETLYKLVKAKYGSTRPVEDLDLVLYGDLKTMFDPHVEDQVWKNQSDYKVLEWKLYDSCGVHSLRKQNVHIHMLVEKRYPLTAPTITDMLNKKLKADHWNEMRTWGSNDFTEVPFDDEQILRHHNTALVTPPPLAYTPTPPVLATIEPLDTFLTGNEVISTIPERENDEFIKSSVDDLVPIPRESELTLDSIDLECSMPIDPPLPCTDVLRDTIVDIDLLLGEHLDTLSTGDREIDFNHIRDIED